MTTNRGYLNPGGLAAALICLVLTACGGPDPMDSGADAHVTPPGDGGMDLPDAYVPPETDAGMPEDDSGVEDEDTGGSCTTGCAPQRDLPPPMTYMETAMIPACMTTLDGSRTWAKDGVRGCTAGVFRESGSNQWMLNFNCDGAGDPPYGGIYRLGSDGSWYANRDRAATENSGELHPDVDCTHLTGEFYHPGGTTPYRAPITYWAE